MLVHLCLSVLLTATSLIVFIFIATYELIMMMMMMMMMTYVAMLTKISLSQTFDTRRTRGR